VVTMLHIVETLTPYGGVPIKLLNLAQRLDANQGRLVFAVFQPALLDEAMRKAGARVRVIGSTSPLRIVRMLDRAIHDEAPTLVCSHHTRGLLTGYVAAKRRGIPLVHHEHSSAHYRTGVGRLAARVILPRVDRIICNSIYTQRSIEAAYPGTAHKACHVYDPVEERVSSKDALKVRDELGICENDIVIGHIGGLIPQRDQATLIRAIAILRRSCPQVKLLLVGDGPERARLESLAHTLDLADNALFTGYRDAGDLLGTMDLYVNPCLDEGFGIAVVEAMFAGLPVVIARAGSHPELIVDGQSGFLYQAGDPDALAARLLRLIHDPDDARRMGAKARMHAEQHFTTSRFLSGYLAAIQPALNTLTS